MLIKPFVGIGTGRCGTKSLAILVDACKHTDVRHEHFLTSWYDPEESVIQDMIAFLQGDDELRGLVSLSYLPLVDRLRKEIPDLKVIHMTRDREKVVESFMQAHRKISRLLYSTRELAEKDANRQTELHKWLHPLAGSWTIFPEFSCNTDTDIYITTEESYQMYWDFYINEVTKLDNVFTFPMEGLNSNVELDRLFVYLEIPEEDQVFLDTRQYNYG